MIGSNIQQIVSGIDKGRLLSTVQEVAVHHRIQGSPGFRAAAEHLSAKLNRQGIASEVLAFPATEDTFFDTYPSFQEWCCRGAWCDLVYPAERRIADFDRNAISIIQKSIPCDYRDTPLDVVLMKHGSDRAAYEGIDFAGKVLFIRDDYNAYYTWAIEECGALGFICDQVMTDEIVRGRYDQLDTIKYTSFFWQKNEKKAFGFMLSPREGDRLEKACLAAEAEGRFAQITCYIDAEIYDGSIEDVMAYLPGETDEEIIITAHLCHPRASANDNASGVAASLELMRVIKDLTESGKLPPLKRGIRMLLIPEFTGTYAYIDRVKDTRSKIMAGFNLDMIGGRQAGGYGPITITDLPFSTPSFITDVAGYVLEEVKKEVPNNSGQKVPMFNSIISKFSGGSDHLILSDPCVGVPTLMLGQWPDKFYHTSSDTVDMVDPHILSKSCAVAAAYAYVLATLEPADIPAIMTTAMARLTADIGEMKNDCIHGRMKAEEFPSFVSWRTKFALDSVADYTRFFEGEEKRGVAGMVQMEQDRIVATIRALTGEDPTAEPAFPLDSAVKSTYDYVPVRTHFTPVQLRKLTKSFSPEDNMALADYNKAYASKLGNTPQLTLMYYIDGKRTAADIMQALYYEHQRVDVEAVDAYLRLLRRLGYVAF